MTLKTTITATSLFSVILLTLHLASDFVNNLNELSLQGVIVCSVALTVVLYGTLMLAGRGLGYAILIFGGLCAVGMPVIHLMSERGLAHALNRPDPFSFVWILIALGVAGTFQILLSIVGLWRLRGTTTA